MFLRYKYYAFAASTPAPSASVRKDNYKTTDRKPTYTATLNENNILLKEIEDKLNGGNGKKDNKVLAHVKKYNTQYAKAIDLTFSVINNIKNGSPSKIDIEKIGVDIVKGAIVAIASAYGFGPIASSTLNGLEMVLTNGEAPLSDLEVLTDDINKQFNKMSDQLYGIEEEISSLSNEVNKSVTDILTHILVNLK